ncbi:unnamed protein product [Rhizopus stolonifer]
MNKVLNLKQCYTWRGEKSLFCSLFGDNETSFKINHDFGICFVFMSLYDPEDVIDLEQSFSFLHSVDDNDWGLLRGQLVTPTTSVCDESILLFQKIKDGQEDECFDLESSNLNNFIETQSVLMEDYSENLPDKVRSILTRRRLEHKHYSFEPSEPVSPQKIQHDSTL